MIEKKDNKPRELVYVRISKNIMYKSIMFL